MRSNKERLNPQHLAEQAKETVREATIGRAQEAASHAVDAAKDKVSGAVDTAKEAVGGAVDKAREAMSNVSDTARDTGSSMMEMIRRNPAAVGLIGIGLSWLFMSRRNEREELGAWDRSNHNPVAAGAVALGLGAAIGLMIPETEAENRMMGETRDQLVDRAQQTAQDVKERAQTVAEEAMHAATETAREEARNQGLSSSG